MEPVVERLLNGEVGGGVEGVGGEAVNVGGDDLAEEDHVGPIRAGGRGDATERLQREIGRGVDAESVRAEVGPVGEGAGEVVHHLGLCGAEEGLAPLAFLVVVVAGVGAVREGVSADVKPA
ncbi:MAG: hypothetical protein R3F14_35550 [Polyangiaceae bacterium]